MNNRDQIICRSLECSAEIGLKDFEYGSRQKLVVDFTADVSPLPQERYDDPQTLKLDYSIAIPAVKKLVESRHFRLLETVAGEVAGLLIKDFHALAAEVTVTKFPQGLPPLAGIAYRCRRERPL